MALTAQELFDATVKHLAEQGGPSKDTQGRCYYRWFGGHRCAAGVNIRDDEYRSEMEMISVYELDEKGLLPARLEPHIELLSQLQGAHDNATSLPSGRVRTWSAPWGKGGIADRLFFVAYNHSLSPASVYAAFPREEAADA